MSQDVDLLSHAMPTEIYDMSRQIELSEIKIRQSDDLPMEQVINIAHFYNCKLIHIPERLNPKFSKKCQ